MQDFTQGLWHFQCAVPEVEVRASASYADDLRTGHLLSARGAFRSAQRLETAEPTGPERRVLTEVPISGGSVFESIYDLGCRFR